VVVVGVGQEHGMKVVGRVRERYPVSSDLLHPALEQPAVDEQPPVTHREQEL
jgi:hypothetical protein